MRFGSLQQSNSTQIHTLEFLLVCYSQRGYILTPDANLSSAQLKRDFTYEQIYV